MKILHFDQDYEEVELLVELDNGVQVDVSTSACVYINYERFDASVMSYFCNRSFTKNTDILNYFNSLTTEELWWFYVIYLAWLDERKNRAHTITLKSERIALFDALVLKTQFSATQIIEATLAKYTSRVLHGKDDEREHRAVQHIVSKDI